MYGSGTARSGLDGQPTLLENYIERACSPMLSQPNMSLNLEIADLINMKKANTPREAAMATLQHVNRRNTHVSMLALHLLDILVKNCGYPFHLQVSTKEFLNELVRRFPEKPPVFPPPPMQKILELIHEWKLTICVTSKHKEDLVHIRDMHRLLSYKGYRFPDVDRRAAQVLNESDRLKSAEELEEEDRAAQSAKLQELIRRGTPKDLAAAQELMKIMAGAEPDKQPDYQAQMQKELDRVQSRVLLLNELLNNAQPGEKFVEGDAFDQLSQKCKQVQPKLQKWINESADNPDMMDRLLLINDLTNNVLERYIAFKAGDFTATAEINPAFAGKDTATAKTRAKEVSLIDFDDPDEGASPTNKTGGNVSLVDGLLDTMSLSDQTAQPATGAGGLPSNLFFDATPIHGTSSTTLPNSQARNDFFSPQNSHAWGAGIPSSSSSITQGISPHATGAISLGGPSASSSSNFNQAALLSNPTAASAPNRIITPSNPSIPPSTQPQHTQPNATPASKPPANDPFADLAGLF
ncbi:hypothetical protein PTTG_03378 [Puccinia triticina 1-1 BBBD Race 1]|uniref:VHS domain-containing protein n=2 Tax=Puccinia triticina TaxID=208348 RepID=A0A180G3A1_PUCT1|nr:uncharacterized protein PtA15_13A181 [Puccinia triticina]OAV87080.1 hypothetical protein PTTG_03378 [Puccinia triticina 1-1 BBBD Race 1]WAQ90782.1 hypothetical protein PtA15_13A181 [Puccinia triticina]WAR60968.1 hypothetical protein PtB15_13B219 [Puccinia triticina]